MTSDSFKSKSDRGIALLEAPSKVTHVARVDEAEWYVSKKSSVVVRHRSGHEVIAVVEIVSPGNKSSRSAVRQFVDKSVEFIQSGVHLLIVDLFPPTRCDPNGLHRAIWDEIGDDDFVPSRKKPLTLASYSASSSPKGYVVSVAVGEPLHSMPLFLEPARYVEAPLESTYMTTFNDLPEYYRDELDAANKNRGSRSNRGK